MQTVLRALRSILLSITLRCALVSAGAAALLLLTPQAHADQRRLVTNTDGQPVRVALYSGEGAFFRSIEAATHLFKWMGAEPKRITAREIIAGNLAQFDILYMTGGWAVPYIRDLSGPGCIKIRAFLQTGGAYIGTCAGAFFAADQIYWEGKRYDYPLRIFPGHAIGPIVEIAPWPQYKLCRIDLAAPGHPITRGEPTALTSLYYGGPWFDPSPKQPVDVIARYAINNQPAIVAYPYGLGRVFLTGVHTEFEEGDDRDGVLWDNDMKDPESEWPLMLDAVKWILRQDN
jgi:glutamine amidotransferase-like uncharacterized protein